MYSKKIHFKKPNRSLTLCGKDIQSHLITEDPKQITCKICFNINGTWPSHINRTYVVKLDTPDNQNQLMKQIHGTLASYNSCKCRCILCRAANTHYHKLRRKLQKLTNA